MRTCEAFVLSDTTVSDVFDLQHAKFVRKGDDVFVFPVDISHASAADVIYPKKPCDDGGYLRADNDACCDPTLRIGEYADSLGITHLTAGDQRDKTIELIEQKMQGVRLTDKYIVIA